MRHLLGLAITLLCSLANAEEERPALVILDVVPHGASEVEATAMSHGLIRGARELEAFQVFSSEDARQFLAIERQKQLLGVSDEAALGMLQSGLGARHVIAGSITKTTSYQLELRLLDTTSAKVISQAALGPIDRFADLPAQVPALAQQLLGHLLAEESGHVVIRSSEEGSEIYIDAQLRGSTPLEAALSIPRGKHRFSVRKSGFIERSGIIRVARGELTIESVTLAPSREFAEAHARKNNQLRWGAWITTGLAVAALGAAVGIDRLAVEPTFQNEFLPRQKILAIESRDPDAVASTQLSSDTERLCAQDTTVCRTKAEQVSANLKGLQYLQLGLLAGGLASAGFATYFWLASEDPARYRQLIVGVAPSPGGATIALSGSF